MGSPWNKNSSILKYLSLQEKKSFLVINKKKKKKKKNGIITMIQNKENPRQIQDILQHQLKWNLVRKKSSI